MNQLSIKRNSRYSRMLLLMLEVYYFVSLQSRKDPNRRIMFFDRPCLPLSGKAFWKFSKRRTSSGTKKDAVALLRFAKKFNALESTGLQIFINYSWRQKFRWKIFCEYCLSAAWKFLIFYRCIKWQKYFGLES